MIKIKRGVKTPQDGYLLSEEEYSDYVLILKRLEIAKNLKEMYFKGGMYD